MGAIEIKVTWITIIIIIIILFFILWLFVGGKNHEFVGINPLFITEDIDIMQGDQLPETVIQILPNSERMGSYNRFERELSENQRRERIRVDAESREILSETEEQVKNRLIADTIKKPFGKSKGERLAKKIMEELYRVEFKTVRPPELRSPETGRNLELDVYSDQVYVNGIKYKIAVEVSGIQHFVHPNFTGQSVEEFKAQVRRDIFKRTACDFHGIYLITVPYTVKEKDMRSYIISMLPACMLPDTIEEPTRD